MKFHKFRYKLFGLGFIFLFVGFTACSSSMHDSYEKFLEGGEIIYPGTPDSIKVHPGKNRIKLSWPMSSDPTVSKAKIYWHNGRDSVVVAIDRTQGTDTVNVMLTDLEEGSYTFNIYTYDNAGNTSIKVTAIGKVYGDTYINSLLQRPVTEATFIDDTLKIEWGNVDETAFATGVTYTNISGASHLIYVPAEDDSTIITDYDFNVDNTFQYQTLYLPNSMAIDTFYTDFKTVKVLGVPIVLNKKGWIATASSYDKRHGTARAPSSAIDNEPATIWVNSIEPQTVFPHYIKVDMGSLTEDIYGLSFIVQERKETPKTIEILISKDDIEWISMGTFTLKNTAQTQFIDFSESQEIRYFKVIAKAPYGSTNNIVIGEIGAYKR